MTLIGLILYFYFVFCIYSQYLHELQDSKRYMTHSTVKQFNGITYFDNKPVDFHMHLDALSVLGGVSGPLVYVLHLGQEFLHLHIA